MIEQSPSERVVWCCAFMWWRGTKMVPGRWIPGKPVAFLSACARHLVGRLWLPNLRGQHGGVDKTWSPLGSNACSSTVTQCYKLLNIFPSCAVPNARQDICLGDLTSDRKCHRDLGRVPASNTSGNKWSPGRIIHSTIRILPVWLAVFTQWKQEFECERQSFFFFLNLGCTSIVWGRGILTGRPACSFQAMATRAASTDPHTCRARATGLISLSLNTLQPSLQNPARDTEDAVG